MQSFLDYCIKDNVKGIICFNAGMTLRDGNREYYYLQLNKLFPNLSKKYIKNYGNSYNVISQNNDELMTIFNNVCEEHNIIHTPDECFNYTSEYIVEDNQITLF